MPVLSCLSIAIFAAFVMPATASFAQVVTTSPEVIVSGQRARVHAPGSFRDEIIKTESLDVRAIEHSNASNLTEALDQRPGVAVQVECSVCNVRNITLNNLPGRFTTLLIDGVPLHSSVSSAYGLDSVNVRGIERIDISRGAGASLIAPEALAGTVNLITKRPIREEFALGGQLGNFGSLRTDAYLARPFQGGALAVNLDYNRHDTTDGTGSNISQYAGFERTLGGLAYFLDDFGGFKLRGRIDTVREDRGGGPSGRDYGAIESSVSGNPFDFRRLKNGSPDRNGWVAPDGISGPDTLLNGQNGVSYDAGRSGLAQIVHTRREQATLMGERPLGSGKLRLAAGVAQHDQDSFYGGDARYGVKQNQYYLEAALQQSVSNNLLTLGLNYRYEDLKSTGFAFETNEPNNGLDDYRYRTPGMFMQVYRALLDNRLELNGSLRVDEHNVFGTITSPRLNVLYQHNDSWASRVALGRGFRAPTSFFEQEHGMLADSRIRREIDNPEIADNASYALSFSSSRMSWVGSLHYNRVRNFATLSPGQPDPSGAPGTVTIFGSAADPVVVKSADWVGTWQATPALAASLGLEWSRYHFPPGTLSFARPEQKMYLMLDADVGPWELTTKATWTGRQDLARFQDYTGAPRYNLNGTPKPDQSPAFTVVDARAAYRLDGKRSIFVGADNLFNYQQAKQDSQLWVDATGALDVTHIWGPSRGRLVYVGAKLAF